MSGLVAVEINDGGTFSDFVFNSTGFHWRWILGFCGYVLGSMDGYSSDLLQMNCVRNVFCICLCLHLRCSYYWLVRTVQASGRGTHLG